MTGGGPAGVMPHVLREYAVVADGRRGAILGSEGDVAWLCFPSWESPSIFDGLLGGQAGYTVRPGRPFVWGGYYEDGSLIWRNRWVTDTGAIIECREGLHFPGDAGRAMLLRRVEGIRGCADVDVRLRPRADYGRLPFVSWRPDGDGARTTLTARAGDIRLRWSGPSIARADVRGRPAAPCLGLHVDEGQHHDLVLELSLGAVTDAVPDPDACWKSTEHAWHSVTPAFSSSLAPREARHSYTLLRGLSTPGGGTVAAATTSLPERAEQGRNYDYRYSWIRDQCFVGHAAAVAGEHDAEALDLLDASVSFVGARLLEDGPGMRPAYTADGGSVPSERPLDLVGYPGGRAFEGNRAATQFQLDAFGEALTLFAGAARLGRLDADGWKAAEAAADAIRRRWERADAGIWELEDPPVDAQPAGLRGRTARPLHAAPAVGPHRTLDVVGRHDPGRHRHALRAPDGALAACRDDDRIDAALVLPALHAALSPGDPRSVQTLGAVLSELTQDGYAYRFRPDQRPLGAAEGAFTLCGFGVSLTLLHQGDLVGSVGWFERGRAACGPAALFTEEYDVHQRQLRGNLPQTFVHAIFLEAASVLGRHVTQRHEQLTALDG